MGKTAKPKNRQPSVHSRAARRAGSPSLNTDKSLKDIKPPKTNPHTHVFKASNNAGIRKKKGKQLKRGQLERHRKGLERADVVKEQLDSKLQKSLGKLKTINHRRKDWEVLNEEIGIGAAPVLVAKPVSFAALDISAGAGGEDADVEVEVEEIEAKLAAGNLLQEDDKIELPVRPVQTGSATAGSIGTIGPEDDIIE